MTVFLASDHAGFALKEKIKSHLCNLNTSEKQRKIDDLGPFNEDRVDYPDFANQVAEKLKNDSCLGILVCGSGQGMAMRANKFPHVRAALCWNEDSCTLSRQHNDSNVLCLGARLLDHDLAIKLVDLFLSTNFEDGRHADRVNKISQSIKQTNL